MKDEAENLLAFFFFFNWRGRADHSKHRGQKTGNQQLNFCETGTSSATLTWFSVKHADQRDNLLEFLSLTAYINYYLMPCNIFPIVF